jgi:hypothetical protein
MKRIYPLTDMKTGRTAYAVWEGSPSKSNPQRLLRPRLLEVFNKRAEAIKYVKA